MATEICIYSNSTLYTTHPKNRPIKQAAVDGWFVIWFSLCSPSFTQRTVCHSCVVPVKANCSALGDYWRLCQWEIMVSGQLCYGQPKFLLLFFFCFCLCVYMCYGELRFCVCLCCLYKYREPINGGPRPTDMQWRRRALDSFMIRQCMAEWDVDKEMHSLKPTSFSLSFL